MTITVKEDNGDILVFEDVIAYDFYDKDHVRNIAEDYGITEVTDEMFTELMEKVNRCGDFPTYNHLGELFQDTLDDLEIDYDGKE